MEDFRLEASATYKWAVVVPSYGPGNKITGPWSISKWYRTRKAAFAAGFIVGPHFAVARLERLNWMTK